MTIQDLITLAEARIYYLRTLRETAVRLGDVHQVVDADAKIAETETTLMKLRAIE